jgi:hypothetical protein
MTWPKVALVALAGVGVAAIALAVGLRWLFSTERMP